MAWFSRIRALFRSEKQGREQDEELQFHLSMREQWNVEHGVAPEEARRNARLQFGNPRVWRERMSEIDLAMLPQTVLQDLRYGARMLFRNSGFTIVSVFALALAIGVNTVAFTAYKALIDRSIEARNPARMVNLGLTRHSGVNDSYFSFPDYEAYRDQLRSFSDVIATRVSERLILSDAGAVVSQRKSSDGSMAGRLGLLPQGASNKEFANTAIVSENYFSVLGMVPVYGRAFGSASELQSDPAVLISENYWQKRFASDPALLGKTIRLNGVSFTVVGITPRDFAGTNMTVPDFWLPLSLVPLLHPDGNLLRDRENKSYRLFGSLAPGVSISHAQAEMTLLASHLDTLHHPHSDWSKPDGALLWPASPLDSPVQLNSRFNYSLRLIMLAVGMVLVIACANVASLQLARAASRRSELCMRLSLGASRLRLIRQLLTECALLGLVAGVVALLCSWAMMKILVTFIAEGFPAEYGTLILRVTPDLGIFFYVLGLSLAAGVLFGLAPALESSRSALSVALKVNKETSSVRSPRSRDFFIAAQVTVSLVLLISGGMLIHSSIHALRTDPGYDIKHVVSVNLTFPESSNYTSDRKEALMREARTHLAALPGVVSVTTGRAPVGEGLRDAAVSLNGEKPSAQNAQGKLFYSYVEPNHFETLGIPFLAGQDFSSQPGQAEPCVILSESAARKYWPGQNPIGRTVRLGTDWQVQPKGEDLPYGPTYQVIGIVADTLGALPDGSDSEKAYLRLPKDTLQAYPMLIRTQGDPKQLIGAVDPVLSSIDPNIVATTLTLQELFRVTPTIAIPSAAAAIAIAVGLVGLLLASMGIYGTVSYVVVLRTREVGIRMALGAKKRDVLRLMLRDVARPVLGGLLAGIVLAVGASYLLRGALHGLSPVDGVSFAGVSAMFLVIALVAAWLPSRRAMRVDPMAALRCE
jgi:predicted permease